MRGAFICRFAICDLPIPTRSISLRAAKTLQPGVTGRVLASFARVCDLVTDGGEVVALVWGGVGNGALNVVLEREPGVALPAGTRFVVDAHRQVTGTWGSAGHFRVDLSTAAVWDARPDWEYLRTQRGVIAANARRVEELLVAGDLAIVARAGQAVMAAYRGGDRDALAVAISALCGLGPGLTPAGDDWLAGWLLALHCSEDLRGLIAETAAARTTTLSRAFLACAAAGEADESWHDLLNALASESANQRINESTHVVLAHGATSGAAMLMGFVAGIGVW